MRGAVLELQHPEKAKCCLTVLTSGSADPTCPSHHKLTLHLHTTMQLTMSQLHAALMNIFVTVHGHSGDLKRLFEPVQHPAT